MNETTHFLYMVHKYNDMSCENWFWFWLVFVAHTRRLSFTLWFFHAIIIWFLAGQAQALQHSPHSNENYENYIFKWFTKWVFEATRQETRTNP